MTKYYEYEEYHRRPIRDDSPDYSSGGGPRESRDNMRLELPSSGSSRPRSQPPPNTGAVVRRGRSRSSSSSSRNSRRMHLRHRDDDDDYYDDSRSRDRSRSARPDRDASPMSKARHAVENNFSNSTTGIGAGLLGAVVGGFAARQASDAASRHRRKSHSGRPGSGGGEDDRTRAISTILGAVVGGLGANAVANRVEGNRERGREKQHVWESRHGREEDLPHYDTGRSGDTDHRNGRGLKYDSEDDDYDYVYDDRRYDDRRPQRRRSEENYRYRN